MEKLFPDNFRELFSFLTFFFGLIFSFISLLDRKREYTLRMTAIFFIFGISLFANNAYCYFASIFIIATAVTQLDFLQNLAAIIRGSKEYFDYKKSHQSHKEVQEKIEKDTVEIEKAISAEATPEVFAKSEQLETSLQKLNLSVPRFYLLVEDAALKYIEKQYSRPIQRYVRIQSKRRSTEFDGLINLGQSDIILEIKVSRFGIYPKKLFRDSLNKLLTNVYEYQLITKRSASLRLLMIGEFTQQSKNNIISLIPEINPFSTIEVVVDFLSFEQIGIKIDNENNG